MAQKVIMAVGGHIGDMELTAGGVLATEALKGNKIVTVALTGGERGCPPGQSVADYLVQKKEEAAAFARDLGGESVVFDIPDCELEVSKENALKLCDLIRYYRADVLITHWKGSLHKDHIAAHHITLDAQQFAGLPSVERFNPDGSVLPAKFAAGPYYAENWEDAYDYKPYVYMEVTPEGFRLWQSAIEHHWFAVHSKDFRYKEYYEHLMQVRGIERRGDYAETFMLEPIGMRVMKNGF